MVPKWRLKVLDLDIQSQEKLKMFQNERLKNIINFFYLSSGEHRLKEERRLKSSLINFFIHAIAPSFMPLHLIAAEVRVDPLSTNISMHFSTAVL